MGSTCGYSGEQKETELTLKVSTYRIEKMELKAFINSEREDSCSFFVKQKEIHIEWAVRFDKN